MMSICDPTVALLVDKTTASDDIQLRFSFMQRQAPSDGVGGNVEDAFQLSVFGGQVRLIGWALYSSIWIPFGSATFNLCCKFS